MENIVSMLILCPLILMAQAPEPLADTLVPALVMNTAVTRPVTGPNDSWFSQDKFLHFYFSASLAGLSYHVYADQLDRDPDQGRIICVSLTSLIGFGKELYDLKKKKHFSWKDLAWDGLGIAAGYLAFAVW